MGRSHIELTIRSPQNSAPLLFPLGVATDTGHQALCVEKLAVHSTTCPTDRGTQDIGHSVRQPVHQLPVPSPFPLFLHHHRQPPRNLRIFASKNNAPS